MNTDTIHAVEHCDDERSRTPNGTVPPEEKIFRQ
jgi:hypothetical protein